jgi:hypothetical protein
MCVTITTQQQKLEEQKTCSPDAWRRTKPGQDEFAYHRLYLKQQKSAGEYSRTEEQNNQQRASHLLIMTVNIHYSGIIRCSRIAQNNTIS